MNFYIGNYWAFILLIFIILVAYISYHSLAGLSIFRKKLALTIRIMILLILIFALSDIQMVRKTDMLRLMFICDVSESIPTNMKQKTQSYISKAIKKMKDNDRASLLVFGDEGSFEFVDQKFDYEFIQIQSQVKNNQTNISDALRLAIAQLGETGQRRILLISDGNETKKNCLQTIKQLSNKNIPIDVLPLEPDKQKEIILQKIIAPANVSSGQGFEILAVVYSSTQTTANAYCYLNDELIDEKSTDLDKGKNEVKFIIPEFMVKTGFQKLKIIVDSVNDSIIANNIGETFTYIHGIPRILYLEGDTEHKSYLYETLTNLQNSDKQRINIELGNPADLPKDILKLNSYDGLIISNISRECFSNSQMQMIKLAVQEGGLGLIMIGGDKSFGAGGYRKTPIEKALPVNMDVTHKKVIPNGALVLILHTCEFAQGNMWAKEIARKSIEVLSGYDLVGILYYDWSSRESWLFPKPLMLATKNNKTTMFRLIDNVHPGDMPSFQPTLDAALKALKKANAGQKHIVIITDGDPVPPTKTLMDKIKKSKITISGIVIQPHGNQDTGRMKYICGYTGGRYYRIDDPNSLPAIFVREALTVKRNWIFEKKSGFNPRIEYHTDLIDGIYHIPKIYGYVVTSPKQLAKLPIIIPHKEEKDPLLAHMQYGLGRSVAFTSDAKNRWAIDWVNWDHFQKFWLQTVRWSLKKIKQTKFRVSTAVIDGKGRININTIDEEVDLIRGVVVSPKGEIKTFPIRYTHSNNYQGKFDIDHTGVYFIRVSYEKDGKQRHITTGLSVSYSAEHKKITCNKSLLHKIASSTGGRVLSWENFTGKDDIFLHGKPGTSAPQDLWPLLIKMALILFVFDVFIRRVIIDYKKILIFFSGKENKQSVELISKLVMIKKKAARKYKSKPIDLKKLEKVSKQSLLKSEILEKKKKEKSQKEKKQAIKTGKEPPKKIDKFKEDSLYTSRLLRAKKKWSKKD